MSYNTDLQSKNARIQALIDKANALPEAGGSAEPVIEALEITENGTYTAPNGVDGYSPVRVNVPTTEPVLQSKTVTPATTKQTVTPDSGYDGLSNVVVNSMPTATQATPSITVSSGGLITASATQAAGYVAAGSKSATQQLPTQAGTTITPTTSEQLAVSAGTFVTGDIKVAAAESGGGGSSSAETVQGTFIDAYESYPNTVLYLYDGSRLVINSGETKSFSVQKNTIIMMFGDSSAIFIFDGAVTILESEDTSYNIGHGVMLLYVTGDFSITTG